MQYVSSHIPTVINLDKSFGTLSPNESYFILNHTSLLTIQNGKGSNSGKGKPLPANYAACDIDQPAGEVYTVGAYRSPLTKEIYSWHINSNGVNYILRTKESGCEIIYTGDCLELSAEPRNSIENWRAFLSIEKICANRHGKQLIWVNGIGDIYQLDVEASIATDSFTTPFFDRCADPCSHIKMCVPDPCGCLIGEWIKLDPADASLNNFMLDMPFQFIHKDVYYDGREGEWSIPSSVYYQSTRGCGTTSGASRCIKLRVPIGNPMVEKKKIAFSNGGDVWYLTETVEKYKKYNSTQEKWYDRSLAELTNYSDIDCSFDYIFCNDRQKIQIDPKEISRVYNPIPRDVQGFIPIKDSFGFYNYKQGTCPVDAIQLEKISISQDCSQAAQDCTLEFATVTVRAVVINTEDNLAGFVYREGVSPNDPDDITKPAYFGNTSHSYAAGYGQKFNDPTRNFIAYVDGEDYWAEMKQWQASNGFVGNQEFGMLALPTTFVEALGLYTSAVHSYAIRLSASSKYMYQEAKIRVPKGTKGFIRLASHFQTSGAGSNQDTSTNVMGTFDIRDYSNSSNIYDISDDFGREVYFDTCNGDVELFDSFFIRDNSALAHAGAGFSGYIKDGNDKPVEGAELSYVSPVFTLAITDHNGFFQFYKTTESASIQVYVERDCGTFMVTKTVTINGTFKTTTNQDLTVTEGDYSDTFFANVIVPVRDCNGNPVSGVRVALSGSKYKITNSNGDAEFTIRNYTTRDRFVIAVVLNENGCFIKGCNDECNPCMPSSSRLMPACFENTPTVTMDTLVLNTESVINEVNGLKSGGRYEWSGLFKGKCGRISAAYPINFMDIPKTQQKGYLGFCSFAYNATGMIAPDWADCFQILRSANLNNYELQWKIDKIERTSEGKIRLTFQSLNDYNKQFGLKTNTTYQWVKGDRIEFIYNGDGTIFTTDANRGVLNYLVISPFHDEVISGETEVDANFFNQLLIDDDGRLDDLKEGAIIELQRPVASQTEQIYYSICAVIPVVNGQLLYPTGTFTTFDAFLVNRTITSQTGSFIGTFEHHSPSDFWGDRISDAGKRYVYNQYENEKRFGRYISINSPTNFSYFGDLVKRFEAPGQGDIIAMWIIDAKIIAAICENDNFLAQAADDLVRVGGDGTIRALPPDAIISDGEPKIYGAYGCQYDDIGSIFFGDGYFVWVDVSKKIYAHHDYNYAKNASLNKTESYFRIRCQEKEKHNLSQTDAYNKFRWATGLNFSTGEIYLTLKKLRDSSINNDFSPYSKSNSTIIYHTDSGEFLGFASFTPEAYSQIDLADDSGCAFVAFSQGSPFVHPIITNRFNEFFGISCDEVVGVVINKFPEKQKLGQAMEIQSEMMWFAAEVTTDKSTFVSEVPPIRWKKSNGKWNSSFLNNKNSRGGLYGNGSNGVADDTRGKIIAITLVRDNTIDLQYGSVNNVKRNSYNELDSIFSKCSFIEESGFTENL